MMRRENCPGSAVPGGVHPLPPIAPGAWHAPADYWVVNPNASLPKALIVNLRQSDESHSKAEAYEADAIGPPRIASRLEHDFRGIRESAGEQSDAHVVEKLHSGLQNAKGAERPGPFDLHYFRGCGGWI